MQTCTIITLNLSLDVRTIGFIILPVRTPYSVVLRNEPMDDDEPSSPKSDHDLNYQ